MLQPVHTRLRPFKCHLCDKAFARQGDLQLHIRRHTGNKQFNCPECGKSFVTSCELGGHVRRMHPKSNASPPAPSKSAQPIWNSMTETAGALGAAAISLSETHSRTTSLPSHGSTLPSNSDPPRAIKEETAGPAIENGCGAAASEGGCGTASSGTAGGAGCGTNECSGPGPTLADALELGGLLGGEFSCLGCNIDRAEVLAPEPELCGRQACEHPGRMHNEHRDCWVRCKDGELHLHHTGDEGLGELHHIWKYQHTCAEQGQPQPDPTPTWPGGALGNPGAPLQATAATSLCGTDGAAAGACGGNRGTDSDSGSVSMSCMQGLCGCEGPTSVDDINLWLPSATDPASSCLGCEIDMADSFAPMGELCQKDACEHPGRVHNNHRDCWVRCKDGELHLHHTKAPDGGQGLHQVWKYHHTCEQGATSIVEPPPLPVPTRGLPHVPRFGGPRRV